MSVPDVCHDVIDLCESQGVVDNGILGFNKNDALGTSWLLLGVQACFILRVQVPHVDLGYFLVYKLVSS